MDVVESPCPVRVSPQRDAATGLGEQIIGLAGRIAAATCRWLLLVADFDAAESAGWWGFPSTARWLMHYCGLSRRTAREHVRVAKALAGHVWLAEEMGAGRLSYSQVRVISRVAEIATPSLITRLIECSQHGTIGQLEELVRGLRTVDANERVWGDPVTERVSHGFGDDSRWRCSAQLEPEHGQVVSSALTAIAQREGIGHAQALARMAEIALAVLADAAGELPVLRGDEHAAVVIHLDSTAVADVAQFPGESGWRGAGAGVAEAHPEIERRPAAEHTTFRGGSAEPPYARIAHGPGLPGQVVRRLVCSGQVRTVLHDQQRGPLDVGRSRRLVSAKQFRALLLRDGGCTHPGCGTRQGLEAHHVRHWLDGGRTDLANLVLLCRAHHYAHHDGEFGITALEGGRFGFARRDGLDLYRPADPAAVGDQPGPEGDEHVARYAAATHWDGTRMDRHYAISVLAGGLRSAA